MTLQLRATLEFQFHLSRSHGKCEIHITEQFSKYRKFESYQIYWSKMMRLLFHLPARFPLFEPELGLK